MVPTPWDNNTPSLSHQVSGTYLVAERRGLTDFVI